MPTLRDIRQPSENRSLRLKCSKHRHSAPTIVGALRKLLVGCGTRPRGVTRVNGNTLINGKSGGRPALNSNLIPFQKCRSICCSRHSKFRRVTASVFAIDWKGFWEGKFDGRTHQHLPTHSLASCHGTSSFVPQSPSPHGPKPLHFTSSRLRLVVEGSISRMEGEGSQWHHLRPASPFTLSRFKIA